MRRLFALLFATSMAALAWGSSDGAAASKFEVNHVRLGMSTEEVRLVLGQPFICEPPNFVILPRDANGDMDCGRTTTQHGYGPAGDQYMGYTVRISYKFRHGKLGSIVVFGLPAAQYDAIEAALRKRFGTPSPTPSGVAWQHEEEDLGLLREADSNRHAGLMLTAAWYASEWKQTLEHKDN